ncbi:uncharacterized protein [Dermacentor albipictus]|uniref:uncharacterized protein isoform X1 n=2 Tax=Dermacentor albipictus TaxID=60249 RepID=UPI0031FBCCEC
MRIFIQSVPAVTPLPTSTTTMKSNPPTQSQSPSTPSPPTKKPPLVCQMMSPNYVTSPSEKSNIINSSMPEPGLCDYIVLDIPQTPDGKFESDGYEFLKRPTSTSKYMFSMNFRLVSSSSTFLDKATLTDSGREILQSLPLRGFGFLGGVLQPNASSFSRATLANYALVLKFFYARFTEVLRGLGVPKGEVVNFFAFKPANLASSAPFYEGLLEGLKDIPGDHLHLVILLTITTEKGLLVQPSSAWDNHCLASDSEPTIVDAVELIAKVKSPVFTFALTLSLRFDIFEDVMVTKLGGITVLKKVTSTAHRSLSYAHECGNLHAGITVDRIMTFGGGCQFVQYAPMDVATFETLETLQPKMSLAHFTLDVSTASGHTVGWLVYNVTGGLAPPLCGGSQHRLKKIREMIDTR